MPAAHEDAPPPGLCRECAHARRVVTRRGASFYRCGRADGEPQYARYPRLPVLSCDGFEAGEC